jgi:Zn-dependent protease with chaperone function
MHAVTHSADGLGALRAGAHVMPGPADREQFFAAQARNRRAAGRLMTLAALGVLLMGVPMSAVISPLLYAAVIILNDLLSLVVPAADLLHILAHFDPEPGASALPDTIVGLLLVAALVIPGSLVMLLAWLGARAVFMRHGTDGLLRSLGARDPRPDDPEERQLQNLVEEMAIAAGVRPPRVVILDGPAANAGAVGSGPDDATLIISRRLLDELDRDESQGVIAQLIASVGNDDLRAALAIVSMHRAFGLVMAVLGAPFGAHARGTLLRLLQLSLHRGRPASPGELDAIDEMLSQSADMPEGDVDPSKKTTVADVLRLPFLIAYTAFWMARLAFVGFVVGPLLALMWRSRRYLADATAVQLTRNPEGVARGVAALASRGGGVPGGSWAAPMFVVGPARGPSSGFRGDSFGMVSYSPPVRSRLVRLVRQGATVALPQATLGMSPIALVLIAVGVTLMGTAMIGCALMLAGVALAIDMLILSPAVMVMHAVLRYWLPG